MEGTGPPVRETVEFTRIAAFTDGVFASAIALLYAFAVGTAALPVPGRLRHGR